MTPATAHFLEICRELGEPHRHCITCGQAIIVAKPDISSLCFVPGYDWASLGDLNSPADLCSGPNQCDNGGLCYPVVTAVTVVTVTTCVCPPRYTGPRCGSLVTRCDEAPCRHGGNCTEDTAALGAEDTGGFRCDCAGTGHSGTHCHIEDNSCAGQTCNNGATCLGEWGPAAFYLLSDNVFEQLLFEMVGAHESSKTGLNREMCFRSAKKFSV